MAVSPRSAADARRRQILRGARACFTRNGFHATSMQDILREAGLSAGSVYRYFRGKDDIVAVIVAEALESVHEAYTAVVTSDPPPRPDTVVASVLARMRGNAPAPEADRDLPQLLIQVFGESLRNEEFARMMAAGFSSVIEQWVVLVRQYQELGWVDPLVNAEDLARTFGGVLQGYLVQAALFGDWDADAFVHGLRGLVDMSVLTSPGQCE
ncbi:TetR/AcrR family transcriptional regulator [Streptomyces armeniacus]|uniref:TetR/AcrR family transcriptional regulator n=1 Tax=Streptomyces armeniacus TaxID=83291 RepID=A0A345XUY8_9ACTN|nr:TetR/AcrR family transcriptional regulator [Streptomyces armeniacus]AWS21299.1 TetR family transcriptional regulator [Streptomyces armeniacus]AXK35454.1 TetR/AcrR family transcriptional regulator [Streptomyces armeniacus]AZY92018.1 putative transcriptional regulator [Streptomyces armeniacus]